MEVKQTLLIKLGRKLKPGDTLSPLLFLLLIDDIRKESEINVKAEKQ